jgi:hypothetical protein
MLSQTNCHSVNETVAPNNKQFPQNTHTPPNCPSTLLLHNTHTSKKPKGEKTIRIATQNLQKGMDDKLTQIKETLNTFDIDVLITQEWAGWDMEEGKYKNIIDGYTNFMSFKKKKREKTNKQINPSHDESRKTSTYNQKQTEKKKRNYNTDQK